MTAPVDETARILALYGTPEKRRDYALVEADRIKREAYAVARGQYDAAGKTERAALVHAAAYESAHAEWAAKVADVTVGYALEIGATMPADGSALMVAYGEGWSQGADMLRYEMTQRDRNRDERWPAFVAGYADGALFHAAATEAAAVSARERAR